MILGKNTKRACIYFIYDKQGIIDDYVIYQLKDLRKSVDYIHCVINGEINTDGRVALAEVADEVFVRENCGNDIGAYKAAIAHIGWNIISSYDELILMNNTCFGPVYPFREVFSWAKEQDVDFWGLTWGEKVNWLGDKGYLHYNDSKFHIQSYFLVIRKTLLESKLLVEFFSEIPDNSNYGMSGCFYEYAFPGYFEERGYKGTVYCDSLEDTNYPLLHNPVFLLEKYRMPLIKKRSFFHHYTDVLNNTAGEATWRMMQYLEANTDYDMDLIWSSILRTCSLSDIVRCAQLNRVLPRDMEVNDDTGQKLRVGLVYHAYYEDLFDEDLAYMLNFPENTGILITTNCDRKKALLDKKLKEVGREATVIVIENRGRDVSSLLVASADFVFNYDLVCFAHDKKTAQVHPASVGRSWATKINENMFATKEFVANVIDMFIKESRLGIAFPSYPNHSGYATAIGSGWTGNYWNTEKLLKEFGINVKIHEHTLCVAPLGTCFWFRPQALAKLFAGQKGRGWTYNDFPCEPNRTDQTILHAIERSYAYFAQDAGYYPVFLYNDKYAQVEFTNLEFQKTGSAEMRLWLDALALEAAGYRSVEETLRGASNQYEIDSGVRFNYGIKESIRHLSYAIFCRFPLVWRLLLPVRSLGKLIFGNRTM